MFVWLSCITQASTLQGLSKGQLQSPQTQGLLRLRCWRWKMVVPGIYCVRQTPDLSRVRGYIWTCLNVIRIALPRNYGSCHNNILLVPIEMFYLQPPCFKFKKKTLCLSFIHLFLHWQILFYLHVFGPYILPIHYSPLMYISSQNLCVFCKFLLRDTI